MQFQKFWRPVGMGKKQRLWANATDTVVVLTTKYMGWGFLGMYRVPFQKRKIFERGTTEKCTWECIVSLFCRAVDTLLIYALDIMPYPSHAIYSCNGLTDIAMPEKLFRRTFKLDRDKEELALSWLIIRHDMQKISTHVENLMKNTELYL